MNKLYYLNINNIIFCTLLNLDLSTVKVGNTNPCQLVLVQFVFIYLFFPPHLLHSPSFIIQINLYVVTSPYNIFQCTLFFLQLSPTLNFIYHHSFYSSFSSIINISHHKSISTPHIPWLHNSISNSCNHKSQFLRPTFSLLSSLFPHVCYTLFPSTTISFSPTTLSPSFFPLILLKSRPLTLVLSF